MSLPYHYSTLNYQLTQSSSSDSINIMWNELAEKTKANSIMFMTPNFDPSIGLTYQEFGTWGNNLINPLLAIQKTMQEFQNGNWMNGCGGNWSLNNWSYPWSVNNNGGSSTNNSEYDALKAVINKYKEIGTQNNTLSPSMLDKINNALNKSGKPEEKLEALKDLYKSLDKTKLEKALLELPDYKIMLDAAGYNFNGTNKTEDTKLKKELNSLEQELNAGKSDKLVLISGSENNEQILRIVSYWNDTHSSDDNRGIIRLAAQHVPTDDSEKTNHMTGIKYLAMSLINKVEDFKANAEGTFTKLDAATEEVSKALTAATKDQASYTKANLEKLADKFDKLYAMLRLMEAERVRNTIKTKYSFLNDISSSDKDIVTDDLVLKSTKEDLKKEGIKLEGIQTDTVPVEEVEEAPSDIDEKCETADEKVEELVKQEHLKKTAKEGVFTTTQTSSTGEPARFYTIKDDKLVELKNVKSIDKDGKCTMKDNTIKEVDKITTEEVTAQDIIDYNNTLKQINDLVKAGTISKMNTSAMGAWPKSVTLYKSKGIQENGKPQYFILKDNKLMKINCTGINPGGTIVINGEAKLLKDLTADDFETVSDSEIVTEDMKKKAEETKAEEEKTQKEEEEAKAKEKLEKTYEPPKMQQADVDRANNIAGLLMDNTNDDEWGEAVTEITRINADNVHTIISRYNDLEGVGTDKILEQIATEQECGGIFGTEWWENKRPATQRLELINHIVKAVIDHCEKYGVKNKYAYTQLKEKYNDGKGITVDDIDNKAESVIRKLDGYIFKLIDADIKIEE